MEPVSSFAYLHGSWWADETKESVSSFEYLAPDKQNKLEIWN